MEQRKKITIMTPCYNEEAGIRECYEKVKSVFADELPEYDYEHLFIDNCSTDRTVDILREIARKDKNVKVIVNSRNFGPHRSPYYGILQVYSDAVIPIMADLQTPPELIVDFVREWESGYEMVLAVRREMAVNFMLRLARNAYYNLLSKIADVEQVKHFTGFGLFDRKVIDILRDLDDPDPYFRGIITEIGFEKKLLIYDQPERKHGKSRNTFLDLINYALLGMTSYSIAPLRLMTVGGGLISVITFLLAIIYVVSAIAFSTHVEITSIPLLLGVLFVGGIQILCLGVLGEYIGQILVRVKKRPLVIEKERINF